MNQKLIRSMFHRKNPEPPPPPRYVIGHLGVPKPFRNRAYSCHQYATAQAAKLGDGRVVLSLGWVRKHNPGACEGLHIDNTTIQKKYRE